MSHHFSKSKNLKNYNSQMSRFFRAKLVGSFFQNKVLSWWSFNTGKVEEKSAVQKETSQGTPDTSNDVHASEVN